MNAAISTVPSQNAAAVERARKRDLWWQFTVRAVEVKHRGSHLGIVWAVLNPLLLLTLYYVVFGVIFGGSFGMLPQETSRDFVLAMFLGLVLFTLFAETINISPTLIVANPNLVKKVVFPLEILPLAQVGASWFHLGIGLVLLLVGAVTAGRGVSLEALWLPVILVPLLLMSIGLAWLLAALGVFFRDLVQVMPFVSQILLYSSAVVYPQQRILHGPPILWAILRWNPILHTVELARDAVLWDRALNFKHLAYTYVCGIVIYLAGRTVFRKLQPAFADVI